MNTRESLINDIKRIGVRKGDTLFLRISYKATGETEGGADTIIDAILDVIGSTGTIIATAFPKRQSSLMFWKHTIYEPGRHITTGIIPKRMVLRANAYISPHPIAPFVCIGEHAKELTEHHTADKDNFSLIENAIKNYHPKCLRIGGELLTGTTHLAFSEGLRKTGNYQLRRPEGLYYRDKDGQLKWEYQKLSYFCPHGYHDFFMKYVYPNKDAVIGEGIIGQGHAMLTDMKNVSEIEYKYIGKDPKMLLCSDDKCMWCRTTYSYSKTSKIAFLFHLYKLFGDGFERNKFMYKFTTLLQLQFMGRKCQ